MVVSQIQGFIQDFLLGGGDTTCQCYDKTLLSLGGSGGCRGAPPPPPPPPRKIFKCFCNVFNVVCNTKKLGMRLRECVYVCVPLLLVDYRSSGSVPGWRQSLTSTREHPAVGMRWSFHPSRQSEARPCATPKIVNYIITLWSTPTPCINIKWSLTLGINKLLLNGLNIRRKTPRGLMGALTFIKKYNGNSGWFLSISLYKTFKSEMYAK